MKMNAFILYQKALNFRRVLMLNDTESIAMKAAKCFVIPCETFELIVFFCMVPNANS